MRVASKKTLEKSKEARVLNILTINIFLFLPSRSHDILWSLKPQPAFPRVLCQVPWLQNCLSSFSEGKKDDTLLSQIAV